MYTIYRHTNTITHKSYIGFTSWTMEQRWRQHIKLAQMGGRRKKVQSVKLWNAIRKYGIDSWTHEVLLVTENEQEAATQEIILIEQFNTFQNGYNTTTGGDGYRAKHCDKTKKKIGEAARISAARMRDEERHRKRSPHTVETKMKMRMAALRRYNHV